jgi:alpha-tubulin suppressor-like RCC1 family protein
VGAQPTCAIEPPSGTVLCWGQAGSGQLGTGPIPMLVSPVAIQKFSGAIAIGAGTAFSCARTDDDAVFCWGDNHWGQLGVGSGAVQTRPVAVPGVSAAVAISAGAAHTCAATTADDGQPLCWGANQGGQLGDGTAADRASPKPVTGDLVAVAVSAGGTHSCAFGATPDGALWCWGRGNAGQLGLGPNRLFDVRQPQPIALAAGAVSASAAGTAHTCVVAGPDGQVLCFGENGDGQLGDGTTTDRSTPTPAPLGSAAETARAVAVSAGTAHTCALDDAGGLWCWGRGDDGQLGDGTATGRLAPAPTVVGDAAQPITAFSAGGAHTCALAGSALYCWGRGDDGELGIGAARGADVPTRVGGLPDPTAVAAGSAHTCALTRAGGVWCWGANDGGQLGDGTTTPSPAPVAVSGLTGVVELAAGGAHTCARRSGGDVVCWGADTSGQLGDGVALASITPQLARIACR